MSKGVNIYDLLHGFWKENECEPFPASATALFFFLVERANSRHWKMPVGFPTAFAGHALRVSRQTVIASREVLSARGLISYSKGDGKGAVPCYTVIMNPKDWTPRLTAGQTADLTGCLTGRVTDDLTTNLTDGLTTYNKKDNKNKDKISLNNIVADNKIKIDVLERIFLSDTEWHKSIISLLSESRPMTAGDVREELALFFRQLRCQRIDEREEKDCRTHFFNWIKKRINENANGTNKRTDTDRRRGSDVTAASAKDYNGAF